ncbi:hypothetical protein RM572_06375 [Streptomyces sp. DSM 42041]|uniref:Uncharacterized protein n=1 Tax=Streptomyces hazeniae TaxID=3075538 RepID=A0ABU2NN71_9ACTN|nr:hypothetical protein [Streptomyces sp. DSM 42041]MDT0378406.1 hypothetical protein [Streptomyces sp. DSM 42041]
MRTAQRAPGTHWQGPAPGWEPPGAVDQLRRLLDLLAESARADGELVDEPLGERWDVVVTVAGPAGDRLLQAMDQVQPGGCGPVICDLGSGWLMWLMPPGTVHRWDNPHGLCVSAPGRMWTPPQQRCMPPGVHWVRPLNDTHLVGPRILDTVLREQQPRVPGLTRQGAAL